MPESLSLLAVLAHPDDESLGLGGTLPYYADRGVAVHLVCATRGERGRFFTNENRPSDEEVGRVREAELRAAAWELGLRSLDFLDYVDQALDRAEPDEVVARIATHVRRTRPQVVVTFDPFGGYGHPDHVAISQFTAAALVMAADATWESDAPPHRVSKLYYSVTDAEKLAAFHTAFRVITSRVDGVERESLPWPEWSVTTRLDVSEQWERVWRAVQCHRTQLAIYQRLGELSVQQHEVLWGRQSFYRVFSLANGGRARERDLFEGLRE